ncbi:MAG: cell division protein ZapA [Bacteroides sp.]|nr:cell division protein ZapA [Bacteroides sp.]
MNDSNNITMTINIGGEHIQLTVPFDHQDVVRDAEKAVATLFDKWRKKRSKKTDKEILAMVAYQFAYFYVELLSRYENAIELAEQCNLRLSEIVGNQK